jgi:methylthioribose-1-phosphate isomerase
MKLSFETVSYDGAAVTLLDQTRLPQEEIYVRCTTASEVADAIQTMIVRGAPAIGITAAFGVALGARVLDRASDFDAGVASLCAQMARTRPTAVNLFWALDRMRAVLESSRSESVEVRRSMLDAEAQAILIEDVDVCRRIGEHGAPLMPTGGTIMTHCNAGALATGGLGTALAVIRVAAEQGRAIRVFANETRPFLQGSRLTAWELMRDGVDVTLLADNAAGSMMARGEVQAIVVGTDRTVANGDVANKIGTYSLAVLAHANGIPFYVAAPVSTIDLSIAHGDDIDIEQRSPDEVTEVFGHRIAPEGVPALNPSFDVTPARYVTGIITENGVARAPYEISLPAMVEGKSLEDVRGQ